VAAFKLNNNGSGVGRIFQREVGWRLAGIWGQVPSRRRPSRVWGRFLCVFRPK